MTKKISLHLNGEAFELPDGATLADLVSAVADEPKGVAIERNGEIVPKSLHANTIVLAGDRIELVQFVGGG